MCEPTPGTTWNWHHGSEELFNLGPVPFASGYEMHQEVLKRDGPGAKHSWLI